MNLELTDLMIRGGVIALLGFGAIQILMPKPRRFRAFSWAVLAFGLILYVIVSAPTLLNGCGAVCLPLQTAPMINPFLLWWSGMALFQDQFRPRLWHAVPALAMFMPLVAGATVFSELGHIRTVAIAALFAHLLYTGISTSRDDLVPARIAFRRAFLSLSVLVALIITGVELTTEPPFAIWLHAAQAFALLMLSAAFLFWASQPNAEIWEARKQVPSRQAAPKTPLAEKLAQKMDDGVWQEEGLTITTLAAYLNVPDHRLRSVINGELGYRNFSSFINERRIAAAKHALLASPDTPVLTIAYDSGFASLGPFNRAFRDSTGMSPTEFRQNPPSDSGNS